MPYPISSRQCLLRVIQSYIESSTEYGTTVLETRGN